MSAPYTVFLLPFFKPLITPYPPAAPRNALPNLELKGALTSNKGASGSALNPTKPPTREVPPSPVVTIFKNLLP